MPPFKIVREARNTASPQSLLCSVDTPTLCALRPGLLGSSPTHTTRPRLARGQGEQA